MKCKPFLEARDFYCQSKQTRLGIKFYQKKILVQVKGDDIKQHYYDHNDDLVFFWLDHTSILLFDAAAAKRLQMLTHMEGTDLLVFCEKIWHG